LPRPNEAPQRYRRHWTVVLQFNQMNRRLKADKHLPGSRPPSKPSRVHTNTLAVDLLADAA
jgi:hypothetical protein